MRLISNFLPLFFSALLKVNFLKIFLFPFFELILTNIANLIATIDLEQNFEAILIIIADLRYVIKVFVWLDLQYLKHLVFILIVTYTDLNCYIYANITLIHFDSVVYFPLLIIRHIWVEILFCCISPFYFLPHYFMY